MPSPDVLARAMAAVRSGTPMRHVSGFVDGAADPHRLYLSLDLDHFVTLPAEYLSDTDADGVTDVWVPADVPLTVVPTTAPAEGTTLLATADEAFALPGPHDPGLCPHCGTDLLALSRCGNPRTSHTLGWCVGD
jgi:hypothetical protein